MSSITLKDVPEELLIRLRAGRIGSWMHGGRWLENG
jgi:hypothetical protein